MARKRKKRTAKRNMKMKTYVLMDDGAFRELGHAKTQLSKAVTILNRHNCFNSRPLKTTITNTLKHFKKSAELNKRFRVPSKNVSLNISW